MSETRVNFQFLHFAGDWLMKHTHEAGFHGQEAGGRRIDGFKEPVRS